MSAIYRILPGTSVTSKKGMLHSGATVTASDFKFIEEVEAEQYLESGVKKGYFEKLETIEDAEIVSVEEKPARKKKEKIEDLSDDELEKMTAPKTIFSKA